MQIKNSGVIILVLYVFVASSVVAGADESKTNFSLTTGNTLYVGGYGPDNYTSIQDAINNASNGDTIFIYPGAYHENVFVNRRVSIIGANAKDVIVDGGGKDDVFYIAASHVKICNLTIKNAGDIGYPNDDAEIDIASSYNIIENNNLAHYTTWQGATSSIHVRPSTENVIRGNKIFGNSHGIYLEPRVSNTEIYDNLIYWQQDAGIGIVISPHSSGNDVYNNSINEGSKNGWECIDLNGDNNKIHDNEIYDSYIGIDAWLAGMNNTISHNYVHDTYEAIGLGDHHTLDKVTNNRISKNTVGIFLSECSGNVISGNVIEFNRKGIVVSAARLNMIVRNNFIFNLKNAAVFYYIENFPGNLWLNNFWGRPHILPKIIPCLVGLNHGAIIGVEFDWLPSPIPHIIDAPS